ncbi:MAG: multicopper oxidase domain-containing protein, partial [Thermoanaerobaculia bacterium]
GYREPQELRFRLSPGNRADFLVKAPATPGDYALTYSVFGAVDAQGRDMRPGVSAAGRPVQEEKARELVSRILEDVAPGPAEPAILLVRVKPCVDCEPMEFPKEVPPLPSYLRPIPDSKNVQTVQFRLNATAPGTEPEQPGAQTTQPQFFGLAVKEQNGGKFIQFNPNCANFTEPLERVETWTLSQNLNNTGALPFHVFHIHTNPFQVVRFGTQTYPEPIWMDSVTLPSIAKAQNGFPTDEASTVVIRQRFEDYTGPYVFHCHFLGHEDRGMMLMVQTTCRNAPGHYGVPDPDGGPDDCAICVTNPEKCLTALAPCFANARTRQQKK